MRVSLPLLAVLKAWPWRRTLLALGLLAALWFEPPHASRVEIEPLPPGREAVVEALVNAGAAAAKSAGFVLGDIGIAGDHIDVQTTAPQPGKIVLAPRAIGGPGFFETPSFRLQWTGPGDPPDAALRFGRGLAEKDDGGFWHTRRVDTLVPGVAAATGVLSLTLAALLLACGLLGTASRLRPRRPLVYAARLAPWVLGGGAALFLWLVPIVPPGLGDVAREAPGCRDALQAYAVAALLLGVPLGLGALAGLGLQRLVRGRGPRWSWAARAAGLLPVGLALLLIPAAPNVGALDLLAGGLLLGAGVAVGRHVGLVAELGLWTLLLLEFAVRLVLPDVPPPPPPGGARLVFQTFQGLDACQALYPETFTAEAGSWTFAGRTRGAADKPRRVLHVGDSMVEGAGVRPTETFVAALARRQPDVAHINAGYSGVGTDYQYLLIQAWSARLPVDLVVLYVFGNDQSDLQNRYLCCPEGPLLTYDSSERPAPRCAKPTLDVGSLDLLQHSPPPFGVRVAATLSTLANHAYVRFGGRVRGTGELSNAAMQRTILRALAGELQARRIPLQVVLLRNQADVLGTAEPGADRWVSDAREALADLGVPVHDALPMLRGIPGDLRRLHLPPPDGIHFSEVGHGAMAAWLDPLIRRALPPPAAPTAGSESGGAAPTAP